MINGTAVKIIGFAASALITLAGFVKSYADEKQNDEKIRKTCNEIIDERFGPVQEVEYTEIEEENT